MKLRREEIVFRDDRAERMRMHGGCQCVFLCGQGVAMQKVEITSIVDVFQERVSDCKLNLAPSHIRYRVT